MTWQFVLWLLAAIVMGICALLSFIGRPNAGLWELAWALFLFGLVAGGTKVD